MYEYFITDYLYQRMKKSIFSLGFMSLSQAGCPCLSKRNNYAKQMLHKVGLDHTSYGGLWIRTNGLFNHKRDIAHGVHACFFFLERPD